MFRIGQYYFRAFVCIETNYFLPCNPMPPTKLSLFLKMKLYPSSSILLTILLLCGLVSQIAIIFVQWRLVQRSSGAAAIPKNQRTRKEPFLLFCISVIVVCI